MIFYLEWDQAMKRGECCVGETEKDRIHADLEGMAVSFQGRGI